METISKKKSITASFVMFALVILMLLFVATPIQMNLGMAGVLITELIFLAMAIVGTLIMKGSFKEVFPLKKPHVRQIFGTIFLWIGFYFVILFSTILIGYLFPESMNQTSTGMMNIMSSVPFPVRFLIVAVSPAICEEAVHRGFILHYLKPINKKWAIVLIMAVLFGLFHLDPTRFLATAILGGVITYVALETGNIFYAFLLHLINNTLSVVATLAVENVDLEASSATAYTLPVVGTYLMILCISPWFIWAGISLLRPKDVEKRFATWKKVVTCVVISVVCVVAGMGINTVGMLNSAAVNVSEQTTIADLESQPYTHEFDITKEGTQQLTAIMTTTAGILNFNITDDSGAVVHEFSAKQFTGNIPLQLPAGHYTLNVEFSNEDGESYDEESPVVLTFMLLQL